MDQKEFTDYIIPKLLEQFPQFTRHCVVKPGDIVDVEYKSNKGRLELWVTTQDKEITIGFSGDENLFNWHTHMSILGANTPEEELIEAIKLINRIINDEEIIICSSVLGYSLANIDEIGELRKYQQPDESLEVTYWSKL